MNLEQACKLWGLEPYFKLTSMTAAFYLLYDEVKVQGRVEKQSEFNVLVNTIDDQLTRYLDAALGGELRHCMRPFDAPPAIKDYILSARDGTRWQAWELWYYKRKLLKLRVLCDAKAAFNNSGWYANYGGKAWGQITDLLLLRLTGEYSKIMFIDQAFSIDHNSGVVFDKLWQIQGLKTVYDAAFSGNLNELARLKVWYG